MHRNWLTGLLATVIIAAPAALSAQRGTLAMGIRQDATAPVPFIGPSNAGNAQVADQLFLRLTGQGASGRTTGAAALAPHLAANLTPQPSAPAV